MYDNDPKNKNYISLPTTLQRVLPRVIPSIVSPHNKDAVDWGWQGFLAYGAQSVVVVIDPVTLQCCQILNKHKTHVTKVKWKKTQLYRQHSAKLSLVLASSELTGSIIIWDVLQGEAIATVQDGNSLVWDFEWLNLHEGSEYHIVSLHPPSVVLWDTRNSTKIWKKSFSETIVSLSQDPFHLNKMAFLCKGCVLFIDDFSLSESPSSNGSHFFISHPTQTAEKESFPILHGEDRSNILNNRVKVLAAGEMTSIGDESDFSFEIIQLLYHQVVHDQLILLSPKELLILDLNINQAVAAIAINRGLSPFNKVIACWQRDVIYGLHESGSISTYVRSVQHSEDKMEDITDIVYERLCHSEPLRLSKSSQPSGFTLNPVTEKHIAVILGDGRVSFTEVKAQLLAERCFFQLRTPDFSRMLDTSTECNLFVKYNYFSQEQEPTYHIMPKLSLSQIIKPVEEAKIMKQNYYCQEMECFCMITIGLKLNIASSLTLIRMCPPLTTRNLPEYVPVLAVGTQGGTIQVINIATGVIEREFSFHTYPIRGIEWSSLTSFLSFGSQPLINDEVRARNELLHTDTKTGYFINLRENKSEESPIEMVKVSYLKQYFIVVLKDDPIELWDCRALTILRTMPPRFPRVCVLEWSATTHIKSRKDVTSIHSINNQDREKDSRDYENNDMTSETRKTSMSSTSLYEIGDKGIIRENMVFTDSEGQLYRFSVEGNVIKDGSRFPPDPLMSTVTCIARKSNDIVLSDSEGTLTILNQKAKTSRHLNCHRGYIYKIRFAPGKDNMKLLILYSDGVDIWDIREVTLVSQLKSPHTMKILDIEWGASDRPVLASDDGCIKIFDIQLKISCSAFKQYFTNEAVVNPYLLSTESARNLLTLLIHQPWRNKFSLQFSEEDGFHPEDLKDIHVWLYRLPGAVASYLEMCGSIAHRALIAAFLFGDEDELKFWFVATYYLTSISKSRQVSEEIGGSSELPGRRVHSPLLDTGFYYLCSNTVHKNAERERLLRQEKRDVNGKLRDDLGRRLAVVGERDRVVRFLLDTDSSRSSFYPDCLRACLLAATHHSAQATSTFKLVATNLIAAGKIWEGAELLCIIGKSVDACRYLQSYGFWDDSVWLAKCVLLPPDSYEIMSRWASHLISSGKKELGICTLISIGDISSALDQLVKIHHHQRAIILLEATKDLNILTKGNIVFSNTDFNSTQPSHSGIVEEFMHNIYRKYAQYLYSIHNLPAVHHYCNNLGDLQQLQEKLEADSERFISAIE